MCLASTPSAPPPTPAPAPTPEPMKKVKKVESAAQKRRKETSRRGGLRSLVINRTAPQIGSTGAGASPY